MKECPYCAELIQDKAIICRYCGRELPNDHTAIRGSAPAPAERTAEPRNLGTAEPGVGISLLVGLLLLIAVYGGAVLLGFLWIGTQEGFSSFIIWYQLAAMLIVTLLALQATPPEKRGFVRGLGVFVLSVIPLAGWLVVYWAGKGIARSASRGVWLAILLVGDVAFLIASCLLLSPLMGAAATASPATPTPYLAKTVEAQVAMTAAAMPQSHFVGDAATSVNLPKCYTWEQVDGLTEGKNICVFGNIVYQKQLVSSDWSGFWNLIRFNDDPSTFYITSSAGWKIKSGDCVKATGPLSYDGNGVPFLKVTRLYKCN